MTQSATRAAPYFLLALSLGACAAAEPPPTAMPPSAAPESAVPSGDYDIRLERGACFGRCPQYRLRLVAGRAEFSGERHVAVLESVQGPVDPAALARLLEQLRAPALARLKDVYRPGQPGCGTVATDMPSSRIDWTLDGQSRRLTLYHGCQAAPAELRALPDAIDEAGNSRRWIREGLDR
ncbi:hypothetical protein ED208_14685 [Stagnimonas aquatica]|uniref:DUF6438 domain-containing protein n=1 Tax=Stagnimonas aquatica TaxID=2689987 RepID=A0A3N0V2K4_9GAMM|nr:DUF6438 domain-containing protein [Stagnimonas aquatica]ROH86688.1 hypothetical protein ED208_14685 [Stagnimonas aquatica]